MLFTITQTGQKDKPKFRRFADGETGDSSEANLDKPLNVRNPDLREVHLNRKDQVEVNNLSIYNVGINS